MNADWNDAPMDVTINGLSLKRARQYLIFLWLVTALVAAVGPLLSLYNEEVQKSTVLFWLILGWSSIPHILSH